VQPSGRWYCSRAVHCSHCSGRIVYFTVNDATGAPSASASFAVMPVQMTVGDSVVGGGTPTAPTFHYVLNGASKSLTLSKTSPEYYYIYRSSILSYAPEIEGPSCTGKKRGELSGLRGLWSEWLVVSGF
jgi:hypothetical protein